MRHLIDGLAEEHSHNGTNISFSINLIDAVERNHVDDVRTCLKKGADVNYRKRIAYADYYSFTPLMIASYNGYSSLARMLIKAGADINAEDDHGFTALIYACYNGNTDIVKMLIDAGANIEKRCKHYECTSLIYAAGQGHTNTVSLLIDAGADINALSGLGHTALISASKEGHTDIVKLLINAGADVNFRGSYRQDQPRHRHCDDTALMTAAFFGKADIVKLLIENGADVNIYDRVSKDTALMCACDNGYYCVRGKRVEYEHKKTASARLILKAGADINARDVDGYTALMHACRNGQIDIVKFLISSGADPTIRDSNGNTAAEIALSLGYVRIANMLMPTGSSS